MSTELSITINYYDDENSAKSYQIYYSSKFEVFIDYRRNGGEINWINIKDSCEIVIHYLEHTRTIKNIESIIIKPRFKDIIKQKGLINIKGRDIFQISELCTKNKVKANDFAIQVRNMLESIKIYSIIDKEVADRLNYINDHIEQIEELFKFVLNYESYLNLKSYDNYNDPKDMVLKRLCIGIMKIESDIVKRFYAVYKYNNVDIENTNLLFEFRPNTVNTIINCIKDQPIDIILNIVKKLFRNYDINKLNTATHEEIIDIITTLCRNRNDQDLIIDKDIEEKLNYISNNTEQIEKLFKFILNYVKYLNLKSYDNYSDSNDMILTKLCIGIMKIESDIIKRDYVIYHCNNIDIDADIENSNLLFLFRPNIAKTIIHCLKNEPTEIVLNIVNKLFRNYDINELNSTTPKEIIDIIVQILGDIKEKNYKTIKNEEKVLTLAQK